MILPAAAARKAQKKTMEDYETDEDDLESVVDYSTYENNDEVTEEEEEELEPTKLPWHRNFSFPLQQKKK